MIGYEFIVLQTWRLTGLIELRFLQDAVCLLVALRTVAAARLPCWEACCQDWDLALSEMDILDSGLYAMCDGAACR